MRWRVWDLPVRVLHWGLVASVAAAAATGGSVRHADLHVAAGAAAASIVALRIGWGFAGERWSRFSGFGRPPGHTRAAAASVIAALGLVALLAATGVVVLAGEERRGALASAVGISQGLAAHDLHATLAWALAAWLALHLAGVLRESLVERQNLVRGMLDGRKRTVRAPVRARTEAAVAMVAAVVVAGALAVPADPEVSPADPVWTRECGDCHVAYPPSLLPARSWEATLDRSADHFGEDLALDGMVREELAARATAGSADAGSDEHAVRIARSVPPDEVPLQITALRWWRGVHGSVPDAGGRCDECHDGADRAVFDRLVRRRTE